MTDYTGLFAFVGIIMFFTTVILIFRFSELYLKKKERERYER
jgi:hypothetical protein